MTPPENNGFKKPFWTAVFVVGFLVTVIGGVIWSQTQKNSMAIIAEKDARGAAIDSVKVFFDGEIDSLEDEQQVNYNELRDILLATRSDLKLFVETSRIRDSMMMVELKKNGD